MQRSVQADFAPELMSRASPFSFTCNRCSKCCFHKRIQVNPFEVARLADNLGVTTKEFICNYTDGGIYLRNRDDAGCMFLTSEGCSVHPDRPLVCRLYPLGRHINETGREMFFRYQLQPNCAGIYSHEGTVQDYLNSQEALPFIEAAKKYIDIFYKLTQELREITLEDVNLSKLIGKRHKTYSNPIDPPSELLSIDETVSIYCKSLGLKVPVDPWEKMDLHIQALELWVEHLTEEENYEGYKKKSLEAVESIN
jgi:uncharacterized protein